MFSRFSADQIFATVATLAVVAGVLAGFWVLGTPGRQRDIAADRQRLQDLQSIATDLHFRYQDNDDFQLPASLDADRRARDPLTDQPYEYRPLGDTTYELCAEFATDSSTYPLRNATRRREFWQHPAGEHCFEFEVDEQPPSVY